MTLDIRLFGEPQFSIDGAAVKFVAPPRTLPLLAYLLLNFGKPVSRARLASLLWPDEHDDDARSNLRRHLHRALRALPVIEGISWIESDYRHVHWNINAPASIDVVEFERCAKDPQTFERAVALYQGDFMDGSHEDEWVFAERRRLQALALDAMYELTNAARLRRDFPGAIALAEQLLAIDEWREDALRALMSARYESGDRSSALATYERFARHLHAEMRVDPMPETTALRDLISNDRPLSGEREREILDVALPASAARGFHLPFVGREQPAETLEAAWLRAARSSGSTVFVAGEPGIGKSRIADELAQLVARQGGRTLTGLTSHPESTPYQPLVDALRRGLPYIAKASIDPLWLSIVAPLIPEVLSLRPDITAAEPIEPEHARLRLHETFVQLFAAIARSRPLLLVLEDLHWAQADTMEALIALARRAGAMPLLILGTYRDDSVAAHHSLREVRRALQSERRAQTIALARLSEEQITNAIAGVPGVDERGTRLSHEIFRLSEGNPLFASQLLQYYVETHAIPDDTLAVGGVNDAIGARLSYVDAQTRAVADVAATIGREFSCELVGEVGGWGQDTVLDALGVLMDRHLVREIGAPGLDYGFTHALIAQAIYTLTDTAARAARHRRIAQCLERANDERQFGSIAQHWKQTGDAERATAAYMRASAHALSLFARADAAEYARHAAALASTPSERFEALILAITAEENHGPLTAWQKDVNDLEAAANQLGATEQFRALEARARYHGATGEHEAQREAIAGMLAHAASAHDARRMTLAQDALAQFELAAGRAAESLPPLVSALSAARETGDRKLISRVHQHLIEARKRVGDIDGAKRELEDLRAETVQSADAEERLNVLLAESSLAIATEDGPLLERVATEMLEAAVRSGDEYAQAQAHWRLGWAAACMHDLNEAREQYSAAALRYERLGQPHRLASTLINLGVVDLDSGYLASSVRIFERGVALASQVGSVNIGGYAHANISDAKLLQGDKSGAREYARLAHEAASATGEHRLIAVSLGTLGAAECADGDLEVGLRNLRAGIDMWRVANMHESLAYDLCVLIENLCLSGHSDQLPEPTAELTALIESNPNHRHPARAIYALAMSARLIGTPTDALALEARARQLLDERISQYADAETRSAYSALPFNQRILQPA